MRHRWKGVFLSEAMPSRQDSEVFVADWGWASQPDESGSEVVLSLLEDVFIHRVDLSRIPNEPTP